MIYCIFLKYYIRFIFRLNFLFVEILQFKLFGKCDKFFLDQMKLILNLIKSLPLFFIIDPSGKFYAAPAKDPTKGAQGQLMSLNEKLKAKGKKSVGK